MFILFAVLVRCQRKFSFQTLSLIGLTVNVINVLSIHGASMSGCDGRRVDASDRQCQGWEGGCLEGIEQQ